MMPVLAINAFAHVITVVAACLIWTLMKWSGMTATKGRMKRMKPSYENSVRRASAFMPGCPKG
jgi:steroid 5-alpha reductase family enzyme